MAIFSISKDDFKGDEVVISLSFVIACNDQRIQRVYESIPQELFSEQVQLTS